MSDLLTNTAALTERLAQRVERLTARPDRLTSFVNKDVDVKPVNYRGFNVALDDDRNASIASANPNGGNFVTPDTTSLFKLTCNYQYLQTGARVKYESILNSGDGNSLVSAKAEAMMKIADVLADWQEFFLCQGDGTQTIATITAGSSGTTITCDGVADGVGAYFVRDRQSIRIYDSTLTTLKGTRTVTKTNSNASFTISSSLTVVSGDKILIDSDTTTPTTAGIKGLPYITNATGAYFNLNKSTNSNLVPPVDTASASMSATKLVNAWTKRKYRNGGDDGNVFFAFSPTQHAYYFQLFKGAGTVVDRAVYLGDSRPKGDVGLADMNYTFFGKPMKEFHWLKPNALYIIPTDGLCKAQLKAAGKVGMDEGDWQTAFSGGNRIMAVDKFHDLAIEYFSTKPHAFGGCTALTFTSLPTLAGDTQV